MPVQENNKKNSVPSNDYRHWYDFYAAFSLPDELFKNPYTAFSFLFKYLREKRGEKNAQHPTAGGWREETLLLKECAPSWMVSLGRCYLFFLYAPPFFGCLDTEREGRPSRRLTVEEDALYVGLQLNPKRHSLFSSFSHFLFFSYLSLSLTSIWYCVRLRADKERERAASCFGNRFFTRKVHARNAKFNRRLRVRVWKGFLRIKCRGTRPGRLVGFTSEKLTSVYRRQVFGLPQG